MKKVLYILLALCLTSCKTKYITVETVRNDTVLITKHQRDSIWLHDSIHVKEYTKGDTVYIEHLKWMTKYIEKATHDTIYEATHDTVPQPYPVTEYVEKQLNWWQKTRIHAGEALFAMLGVGAIFAFLKLKFL